MTVEEELSALMGRFFRAVSFGAGETPAYERLHEPVHPGRPAHQRDRGRARRYDGGGVRRSPAARWSTPVC
jgi:hypothetical protein